MNDKSTTLSEAKQKRVEKKFLICTLNSQIMNWCTKVSEKPLQAVFSSTELYLLPAVSPLALHRSHSSSLPPSSTSAQNPIFCCVPSLDYNSFPIRCTTDSQPYPSQLRLTIPSAPVIQTITALFPIPTSWSFLWHYVPGFSIQALCGFICSSSI